MSEEQKNPAQSVEGKIIISGRAPSFAGATAHISLEDISYQDSESVPIAETIIPEISHEGNETIIPFRLPIEDSSLINEKNDYSVNVWIDVNSNNKVGENDLFNDENYMVLTHGFGNLVEIKIK
jgi:uncharacterized lipoprotein YbaY